MGYDTDWVIIQMDESKSHWMQLHFESEPQRTPPAA